MTAHEFYLAAQPWWNAIRRAQRHGWIACGIMWGPVFLWHPSTTCGIVIRPDNHLVVIERATP